jgi:DMSO/TMAO reductase YedYZ heme-binding membrane subunit
MISISQWRITGVVAIVLAILSALNFAWLGFSEEALRSMIRATATSSVLLFVLAFTASSLFALFKTRWARYLLQNRRYFGVSFAFSHFVHLLFLILLMKFYPEDSLAKLHPIEIGLASLTYLFILAMTITSFDPPRRWLGPKAWHWLHSIGMYLIWLIFLETYGKGALQDAAYIPVVFLLLAGMGLRITRMIKSKPDSAYSPR